MFSSRHLKTPLWLLLTMAVFVTGSRLSAGSGEEARKLHALFEKEWEVTLRDNPTFASSLGEGQYNHLWPDISLAAIERRHQHRKKVLEKLSAIDLKALSAEDRINYVLFEKSYALDIEAHPYRWYLLPLNQRGGIQTAHEIADTLPFSTLKDYQDWIARLDAIPTYVEQTMQLMREGIQAGILHPRVIMERIPGQIRKQIVDDPAKSLFYGPFRRLPKELDDAKGKRLAKEARRSIRERVVPAFRVFEEFFENEYLPACFEAVGIWQIPRGKEFYALQARRFTSTDLTPEQIHAIGQKEVRRIRKEMDEIIKKVGFKGDFQEFLHFLRTDSRFYYDSPKELLEGYRALTRRIDPELVRLFGRLPRTPYGVEPIPENIAPDTTTAYYRPPAADVSRAGTYFVNLYRPEVRPKYEMEALSIHEAVPGHHLQIALAQELEYLPAFRRFGGYTAFVEGWALYSESLGEEMGFYEDPYSKFGQLTYEMWRAVRLVVDTGIHFLGWTRSQAIDFFKANAAKTELDIINEIDRYIAWPGQALAYKIGELKIKELRARATAELGERFDLRTFHDIVLGSGAVPLDVLESRIEAWITDGRK